MGIAKQTSKLANPHRPEYFLLLKENLPSFELHDALDFRSVERVDHCLPLSDLELRLAVGEGEGDRRRVVEILVVAKASDGSPLGVLSYIVIGEFGGGSQKRAE